MFIDQVTIKVKAGKGGDGIVAYRRENKVQFGGPFGGNGGKGGDIIFRATTTVNTLSEFRYKKDIKGKNGENGMNKGKYGKNAEDTIFNVPVGTVIYNKKNNKIIADLNEDKLEIVIAKGGRGGRGNMAFSTGKNPCPSFSERGEPGEELELFLELKVIADCGLVGFPSVGKSTLLRSISNARPEVASYHFTTLNPHLGIVDINDERSFVMADLPGLIEGASEGLGLGYKFLKHIERCKVIVHIIDIAQVDGRDPISDYKIIRKELEQFSPKLASKPEIIVLNKIDLVIDSEIISKFESEIKKKIIKISALNKDNIKELLYAILYEIDNYKEEIEIEETIVNYNYESNKPVINIEIIDNVFNVYSDDIYKIYQMTNFNSDEGIKRFIRILNSMGLEEALKEKGITSNDTVKIYDYEFDYVE